jgi:hypothetical protein
MEKAQLFRHAQAKALGMMNLNKNAVCAFLF